MPNKSIQPIETTGNFAQYIVVPARRATLPEQIASSRCGMRPPPPPRTSPLRRVRGAQHKHPWDAAPWRVGARTARGKAPPALRERHPSRNCSQLRALDYASLWRGDAVPPAFMPARNTSALRGCERAGRVQGGARRATGEDSATIGLDHGATDPPGSPPYPTVSSHGIERTPNAERETWRGLC
jgi:hypothetical protein